MRRHDLVPLVYLLHSPSAAIVPPDAAEWVREWGIRGKKSVDCFFLEWRRWLSEKLNNSWNFRHYWHVLAKSWEWSRGYTDGFDVLRKRWKKSNRLIILTWVLHLVDMIWIWKFRGIGILLRAGRWLNANEGDDVMVVDKSHVKAESYQEPLTHVFRFSSFGEEYMYVIR